MSRDLNLIINEIMKFPQVLAYIGEVIIKDDDKERIVPAYKKISDVVFDSNTYNFHIFPQDRKESQILANEYFNIAKTLKTKLNEFKDRYVVSGGERTGRFELLYNKETLYGIAPEERFNKEQKQGDLFKYVAITINNVRYEINFMRYTCDKNKIGATMRAIQFHKVRINGSNKGFINYDENNNFAICYTKTDKDSLYKSANESDYYKTNGINVCYNPPVTWPKFNEETGNYNQDDITNIIDWFIYFIEKKGEKECLTLDKYNAWKVQ